MVNIIAGGFAPPLADHKARELMCKSQQLSSSFLKPKLIFLHLRL